MGSKPNKVKKRNSSLQNLTKEDLRHELRKRGVKASGKKSELVKRLEKFDHQRMASDGENIKKRTATTSLGKSSTNGDLSNLTSNATVAKDLKELDSKERDNLVLWKHPFLTLEYFCRELKEQIGVGLNKLRQNIWPLIIIAIISIAFFILCNTEGAHETYVKTMKKYVFLCSYWMGLGILSSIGLGTGLHTFLLYLGPHIAEVTLAASECGSLNFPEPPYPDEILCPEGEVYAVISILSIMSKVRLEACMWGVGTAIGELPPYFMARASRLSGTEIEDEDLRKIETLIQKREHLEKLTYLDRLKLMVQKLIEKVGFFGILLCASIPNPLFDLAGITCGHFLVPFWTFFGATLIGKAIIKMHLQKMCVIVACTDEYSQFFVGIIGRIPYLGKRLQMPIQDFLNNEKAKLHGKTIQESSWLSSVFECLVFAMVFYFIVSIINSMAQNYHKRMSKSKASVEDKKSD